MASLKKNNLIILASVIATGALVYLFLFPGHIVQVSTQLQSGQARVQLLSPDELVRPNAEGVVYFDLRALITDSPVTQVALDVRPSPQPKWYPQGTFVVGTNGLLLFTVTLGSPSYPVNSTTVYTFRLTDVSSGNLLADGQITAAVETIADQKHWLIGAIGLLAAVLQVISFLVGLNQEGDRHEAIAQI